MHPPQSELPGAHFLFGGYCWIKKRFDLWSIQYNSTGRPCLGYEQIDRTILDPDTFAVEHPVYTSLDEGDAPEEATDEASDPA